MGRGTHLGPAGQMPSAGYRHRNLDHPWWHHVEQRPAEKSHTGRHRLSGDLLGVHQHRHPFVGKNIQTADTRLAGQYRCNWVHSALPAVSWWMRILGPHIRKREGTQSLAGSWNLGDKANRQDSQNLGDNLYWMDIQAPVMEHNLILEGIHLALHTQGATGYLGTSLGISQDTSQDNCPRTFPNTVRDTFPSIGLEGHTDHLARMDPQHPDAPGFEKQNTGYLKTG